MKILEKAKSKFTAMMKHFRSRAAFRNLVRIVKDTHAKFGFKGVVLHLIYFVRYAGSAAASYPNSVMYQKWIREYETLSPEQYHDLKLTTESFRHKPLISVIMPVYNANPKWLSMAIESVRTQSYTHWELCIADDASTDGQVLETLKHYQQIDPRIIVNYRSKNGHISQASNSALEMASGEWLALLDHDDLLAEHALFWVVKAMNQKPELALIFSDEDKLDKNGRCKDPYFKCDWNYSLFLSQNMISHLGVYKTELVKKIGGFRKGYEGSQDYDLALRCIEQIAPGQIHHIPRVLYHWRVHPQSAASGIEAKNYAVDAAQRALADHMERTHADAEVVVISPFGYRIKYTIPEPFPLASIIIPTKNNKYVLQICIESIILKTDYSNYEILIVDNNSDDPETKTLLLELANHKQITVISDTRPFNFSAINNKAVENASGAYICFLNDDTEVISPGWLTEMLSHAMQPGVGVVGARLWYPDDRLQHGGVILGLGGIAGHTHKFLPKDDPGYFGRANLIQEFSAVTAACMVMPLEVLEQAGGFDEENLGIAYNDVDLCLKIKTLGYRIIWTPFAELYHHESVSRGNDFDSDKIKRFIKENKFMLEKWGDIIANDPAYSPNLTLESENFGLAWPPRISNSFIS